MDFMIKDGHPVLSARAAIPRRWRELGSRLSSILIGLPRNKRISAQSPGAHEPKKDLVPAACEGRLSLNEGEGEGEVARRREFSTATLTSILSRQQGAGREKTRAVLEQMGARLPCAHVADAAAHHKHASTLE